MVDGFSASHDFKSEGCAFFHSTHITHPDRTHWISPLGGCSRLSKPQSERGDSSINLERGQLQTGVVVRIRRTKQWDLQPLALLARMYVWGMVIEKKNTGSVRCNKPQIFSRTIPGGVGELGKPWRSRSLRYELSADLSYQWFRHSGEEDQLVKLASHGLQERKKARTRDLTHRVGDQCPFQVHCENSRLRHINPMVGSGE